MISPLINIAPDEFQFVENGDGVHLVEVVDSEFTLCGEGLAGPWNNGEAEPPEGWTPFRETRKTVVTCPNCIAYLKSLRTVKIKESA